MHKLVVPYTVEHFRYEAEVHGKSIRQNYRCAWLDHPFCFQLYQGKKTKYKELGPAKLPVLQEGFVISDLFIMRFHCTIYYSKLVINKIRSCGGAPTYSKKFPFKNGVPGSNQCGKVLYPHFLVPQNKDLKQLDSPWLLLICKLHFYSSGKKKKYSVTLDSSVDINMESYSVGFLVSNLLARHILICTSKNQLHECTIKQKVTVTCGGAWL